MRRCHPLLLPIPALALALPAWSQSTMATHPPTPGDREHVLTGHLQRGDGQMLESCRIQATLGTAAPGGDCRLVSVFWTEADGTFRYDCEEWPELSYGKALSLSLRHHSEDGMRWETQLELGKEHLAEVNEVGILRLGASTSAMRGTVLGKDGLGLAGATIQLEQKLGNGQDSQLIHWIPIWDARTTTNAEGKFLLYPPLLQGPYRLILNEKHYLPMVFPCETGQHDHVVPLIALASVSGSILIDPAVDWSDGWDEMIVSHSPPDLWPQKPFQVRLHDGESIYDVPIEYDSDEVRFNLEVAPTSDATLEILSRIGERLLRLEDLDFVSGETLRPLAVNPFDVRNPGLVFEVQVQEPSGDPIGAVFHFFPANEGSKVTLWGRRIQFYSKSPFIPVHVSAQGFRSQFLHLVAGKSEVVMQKGIPGRLLLPEGLAIPESSFLIVSLALIEDDSKHGSGGFQGHTFLFFAGQGGFQELFFSSPGTYGLSIESASRYPANNRSALLVDQVITVLDQEAVQAFVLNLTQKMVDKAIH